MAWYESLGGGQPFVKPDGKTVIPINDVVLLQQCAGIADPEYDMLTDMLADEQVVKKVCSDDNAIDYMVRSTQFASGVTGDSYAMICIGQTNYAADTLIADSTWYTAIQTSAYFDQVLTPLVPVMTTNLQDGYQAYTDGNSEAYEAFDDKVATAARKSTSDQNAGSIRLTLPEAKRVYRMQVLACRTNVTFHCSDNNANWTLLSESISITYDDNVYWYANLTHDYGEHIFWNLTRTGLPWASTAIVNTWQLYGRDDVDTPNYTKKLILHNGSYVVPYAAAGKYTNQGSPITTIQTKSLENLVYITLPNASGYGSIYGTDDPIDLTSYSTLHVRASGDSKVSSSAYYGIIQLSLTTAMDEGIYTYITSTDEATYGMDVSNLSDSYYISVRTNTGGMSCKVYEVWLD